MWDSYCDVKVPQVLFVMSVLLPLLLAASDNKLTFRGLKPPCLSELRARASSERECQRETSILVLTTTLNWL